MTISPADKDQRREAAIRQWWKMWWQADYSWDGLKQHKWQGWVYVEDRRAYKNYIKTYKLPPGSPDPQCQVIEAEHTNRLRKGTQTRPATLQDYWRDQADHLIDEPGSDRQWTIAHLPPQWQDGTQTWKSALKSQEWDGLDTLLSAWLAAGASTDNNIDSLFSNNCDRRSQFQGLIVKSVPARITRHDEGDTDLHINARQMVFLSNQYFDQAIFGSPVNFRDAQFSGGDADFNGAQFSSGDAIFRRAQFRGGHAYFDGAQFLGKTISFKNTTFDKAAYFNHCLFPLGRGSEGAFHAARFQGLADFSGVPGPSQSIKDNSDARTGHFPYNAFADAFFVDKLILPTLGEDAVDEDFKVARTAIKADIQDQGKRNTSAPDIHRAYIELERGCNTLKKHMEDIGKRDRALLYGRFELIARQHNPQTAWLVRSFSYLYGLCSNYGSSLTRPLGALLFLNLIFALIYGVNAECLGIGGTPGLPPSEMIFGPISFSAAHIFRPLAVWSRALYTDTDIWLIAYRDALSPGGWLTIRLLASAQSFMAITLIFLFGLGLKRKFQIG